jgi:rhodanese-related sulfurtransferase
MAVCGNIFKTIEELAEPMKTYKEWTPQQVIEMINKGDELIIIDVREPEEYIQGRIHGSKLLPMGQIPEHVDEFDSAKEYLLVCRSGNRSGKVCEYLIGLGKNVVNMKGGMLEWEGEVDKD